MDDAATGCLGTAATMIRDRPSGNKPFDAEPLPAGERDDLRTLGRLLGDVIREAEGGAVFDRIEGIRQAAVATVALANKTARIAWAVMSRNEVYAASAA